VSAIITAPAAKGVFAANLLVSRERTRPGETFPTYVSRQLIEYSKNLRQFRLHSRRDVELRGGKGHLIACGWQGERGPLEQRITMVPRAGEELVITFTATMTKKEVETLAPVFEEMVATAEI
jgi:hypothetical protein